MITFQLFIELTSRKSSICSAKQVTYIKLHVYMYFWFFTWEDLLLIKPAWGLPAWVICRTALTANYRYPKTNPLICSRSSFIVPFIDLVECHFLGGGGNSFIFFFHPEEGTDCSEHMAIFIVRIVDKLYTCLLQCF